MWQVLAVTPYGFVQSHAACFLGEGSKELQGAFSLEINYRKNSCLELLSRKQLQPACEIRKPAIVIISLEERMGSEQYYTPVNTHSEHWGRFQSLIG